jgi:methane/ammonia monooxygenase subunit C
MALGVFGVVIQLLLNIHRVIGKDGVELLTGA